MGQTVEERLERIERKLGLGQEEEKPECKFGVGEVVRCVDPSGSRRTELGDLGEVIKVEDPGTPSEFIHVRLAKNGLVALAYASRYERWEKRPIRAGDRVKCIDDGGGHEGKVGSIYRVQKVIQDYVSPLVCIQDENGKSLGTGCDFRFQLISDLLLLPSSVAPAFRAGDIVRCVDEEGYHGGKKGQVYTVESITDSHATPAEGDLIKCKGLSGGYARRFELVWRPPPGGHFRPGDVVRCIDPKRYDGLTKGMELVVDRVDEERDSPDHDMITPVEPIWHNGTGQAYAYRFELVDRLAPKEAKHEPPKPAPSTDGNAAEHPLVRILGWSNVDGTFNLVLEPVGPDGRALPGSQSNINYTLPKNTFVSGVRNLARWAGLKLEDD